MGADEIRRTITDRLKLRSYYRDTFANPQNIPGTKVLEHLCKQAKIGEPIFCPGDPHQTAFNAGAQSVVMAILRYSNKSITDLIKQLEQEHDTDIADQ